MKGRELEVLSIVAKRFESIAFLPIYVVPTYCLPAYKNHTEPLTSSLILQLFHKYTKWTHMVKFQSSFQYVCGLWKEIQIPRENPMKTQGGNRNFRQMVFLEELHWRQVASSNFSAHWQTVNYPVLIKSFTLCMKTRARSWQLFTSSKAGSVRHRLFTCFLRCFR